MAFALHLVLPLAVLGLCFSPLVAAGGTVGPVGIAGCTVTVTYDDAENASADGTSCPLGGASATCNGSAAKCDAEACPTDPTAWVADAGKALYECQHYQGPVGSIVTVSIPPAPLGPII